MRRIGRLVLGCAVMGALVASGPVAAASARGHHRRRRDNATRTANANRNGETPLTGTTLAQASAAALAAVPGGTVTRATTETDGTGAHEVFVTRSDGTRVRVLEDASFNVLSVTAAGAGGCRGG